MKNVRIKAIPRQNHKRKKKRKKLLGWRHTNPKSQIQELIRIKSRD